MQDARCDAIFEESFGGIALSGVELDQGLEV